MNQAALELLVTLKDQATKGLAGIGSSIGNLGKVALGGFAVAGTALAGFIATGIAGASEAEDALAQMDAVIKSTGGAAGVTSKELQEMADGFQLTTKFGAEATMGAQSMLLTFTNIGKEVFPATTQTALDMSQALGQDLKASSIQLGKALNDPIAGISALSKVGVTFTDDQKKMIEKMMKSNNIIGAQKVILAELNKEFGGSAAAAGKTFSGQLEIAKNMLGEFGETIGGKVMPLLTPLIGRFIAFATDALPKVEEAIEGVSVVIGDIATFISDAINGVISFVDQFTGAFEEAGEFTSGFGEQFGAAIDTVLMSLGLSGVTFQEFGSTVDGIITSVKTTAGDLVAWFQANWPAIQTVISSAFATISTAFTTYVVPFVTAIVAKLSEAIAWVIANWPMIQAKISEVFTAISGIVNTYVVPFVTTIIAKFNEAVAWVTANWPAIQAKILEVFTAISGFVTTYVVPQIEILIGIFSRVVAWVTENWPLIQQTMQTVFTAIQNVVAALTPIIQPLLTFLVGAFVIAWEAIKVAVQVAIDLVLGIIKTVMQLINGDTAGAMKTLETMFATIWGRISGAITTVVNTLKAVVAQAMTNIKTEVLRIMGETVAYVESLPAKFVAVGENLIKGIWAGISSMGEWFKGKFFSFLQNVLPDFAQKALGISSPSEKFAKGVGVPVVQGIMAGIISETPNLLRVISEMGAKMMAATSMAVAASPGGMGGAVWAAAEAAIAAATGGGGGAVTGVGAGSGAAGAGSGAVLSATGSPARFGGIVINNTINNEMDIDKMTNLMARRVQMRSR